MSEAKTPYRVRASSWGSLFDCAHRWEGTHLLGMRGASSPRAALGTAIHAGTAHYDTQRLQQGQAHPQEAGEILLEHLEHPREDVNWRGSDISKAEAERIGLTLLSRYCADIAPRFHYVAIEMETKPLVIDCGGGIEIQLTGTMDRARAISDEYGARIADIKSGTRATELGSDGRTLVARTKGHAPQIATYELLYEHTTGEPITGPGEIIGLNTGKVSVAVSEVRDARKRLVGSEESPGLIEYAATMFRTGMFPPNPSSTLCSQKYCSRWSRCNHHD